MNQMTYDEFVIQMRANFDLQDIEDPKESIGYFKRMIDNNQERYASMVGHFQCLLHTKDQRYQQISLELVNDEFKSEEDALEYLKEVWKVVSFNQPFPER